MQALSFRPHHKRERSALASSPSGALHVQGLYPPGVHPKLFFVQLSSRPAWQLHQAEHRAPCRRAPSRSRSWLHMTRARCGPQATLLYLAVVLKGGLTSTCRRAAQNAYQNGWKTSLTGAIAADCPCEAQQFLLQSPAAALLQVRAGLIRPPAVQGAASRWFGRPPAWTAMQLFSAACLRGVAVCDSLMPTQPYGAVQRR